jgi:hypothetical protein
MLRQQMLLEAAAKWLEELWTVAEKNFNLVPWLNGLLNMSTYQFLQGFLGK